MAQAVPTSSWVWTSCSATFGGTTTRHTPKTSSGTASTTGAASYLPTEKASRAITAAWGRGRAVTRRMRRLHATHKYVGLHI